MGSGLILAILQEESARNLLFGFSIIFVWIKARVEKRTGSTILLENGDSLLF